MTDNKISAEAYMHSKRPGIYPKGCVIIKSEVIKLIEDFAKELSDQRCKEQREICSTLYYNESIELRGSWSQGIKEKIRNAPPPK